MISTSSILVALDRPTSILSWSDAKNGHSLVAFVLHTMLHSMFQAAAHADMFMHIVVLHIRTSYLAHAKLDGITQADTCSSHQADMPMHHVQSSSSSVCSWVEQALAV